MTNDLFAERFAGVRSRFVANLDGRIEEIESSIPALCTDIAMETLASVHRRAHDLCGVGATMGFVGGDLRLAAIFAIHARDDGLTHHRGFRFRPRRPHRVSRDRQGAA